MNPLSRAEVKLPGRKAVKMDNLLALHASREGQTVGGQHASFAAALRVGTPEAWEGYYLHWYGTPEACCGRRSADCDCD